MKKQTILATDMITVMGKTYVYTKDRWIIDTKINAEINNKGKKYNKNITNIDGTKVFPFNMTKKVYDFTDGTIRDEQKNDYIVKSSDIMYNMNPVDVEQELKLITNEPEDFMTMIRSILEPRTEDSPVFFVFDNENGLLYKQLLLSLEKHFSTLKLDSKKNVSFEFAYRIHVATKIEVNDIKEFKIFKSTIQADKLKKIIVHLNFPLSKEIESELDGYEWLYLTQKKGAKQIKMNITNDIVLKALLGNDQINYI